MEVIKIKDLPILDRPREKAQHYGIDTLSNIELLALIIGSGGRNSNALNVASSLLKKSNGIDNLLNLTYKEYLSIPGIKVATAFRFLAIGEFLKRKGMLSEEIDYGNSKDVADRYKLLIGSKESESMFLLAINSSRKLIYERELYKGTYKSLVSSEEEIIKELKDKKVRYFILVHNHPSGDTSPSEADLISTNRLKVKSFRNNIKLLDHIIVSDSKYTSFKENDLFL